MYPGKGTVVLIRPAQTFYERIIVAQEDASVEILKILNRVETKLGALAAWQGLTGQAAPEPEMLGQAPRLIVQMRELVAAGNIGYWLLVAEKPG